MKDQASKQKTQKKKGLIRYIYTWLERRYSLEAPTFGDTWLGQCTQIVQEQLDKTGRPPISDNKFQSSKFRKILRKEGSI